MTRGLMTLRSDKLVVHQDADGYQYGTATAQPNKLVFVRQENQAEFEVVEDRGVRAEYNGKTDEIEMIGPAVVTRFKCGNEFETRKNVVEGKSSVGWVDQGGGRSVEK